jgi:NitT/TauT family transport system substrate-binding protein
MNATIKYGFRLLLLVVFGLSACSGIGNLPAPDEGGASEDEVITLTINTSTNMSFAPVFIAEAEGYFEEAGVELDYVTLNRGSDALPLLVTGEFDVYGGGLLAATLNTVGAEEFVKVVADRGHISPDDECAYHGILVQKDLYDSGQVAGPADFAGLTIDSTASGPSGYVLDTYLAQAGLTFDDVELVRLPETSYVDAFSNAAIDALINQELRLSWVLNTGDAVLLVSSAEVVGVYQTSVMTVGKSILEDNRDAGVRFLIGYLRGVRQYNEGKTDRNLEILTAATGETEETLRAACWVPIDPEGWIDFANGVAPFVEWNVDQGLLDASISEDQFWDPSLLQEALKALDQ